MKTRIWNKTAQCRHSTASTIFHAQAVTPKCMKVKSKVQSVKDLLITLSPASV